MSEYVQLPVSERGIWLAAKSTIMACGGDAFEAEVYAAQVADGLLAKGDMTGRRLWQRVQDRIAEMRRAWEDGKQAN